jgi:hypothetical protein
VVSGGASLVVVGRCPGVGLDGQSPSIRTGDGEGGEVKVKGKMKGR